MFCSVITKNSNWKSGGVEGGRGYYVVFLDQSNNTGAIVMKMDGSVLEEKPYLLRCWG